MIPPRIEGLSAIGYQQLKAWMMDVESRLDQRPQSSYQTILQAVGNENRRAMSYTLSSALTLTAQDMGAVHYCNCSSSSNLTLPGAFEGAELWVFNSGSGTITLKDGGTSLASVPIDSFVYCPAFMTSAGVPQWPTALPVYSKAGVITPVTSGGIAIKDASNHYWIVTIGTDGAITTTDNGVVPPL